MTEHHGKTIVRRRHWALIVIRSIAMLLLLYGGAHMLIGVGVAIGFSLGNKSFLPNLVGTFWDNNYNAFWHGFAFAATGLALALASRAIADWIVPVLRNHCPLCGYELEQLKSGRCPECGFELESVQRAKPD